VNFWYFKEKMVERHIKKYHGERNMAENIVNSSTDCNGFDVETFEITERKPWNVDALNGQGSKRDWSNPGYNGKP
jgi:hypothetical protein